MQTRNKITNCRCDAWTYLPYIRSIVLLYSVYPSSEYLSYPLENVVESGTRTQRVSDVHQPRCYLYRQFPRSRRNNRLFYNRNHQKQEQNRRIKKLNLPLWDPQHYRESACDASVCLHDIQVHLQANARQKDRQLIPDQEPRNEQTLQLGIQRYFRWQQLELGRL